MKNSPWIVKLFSFLFAVFLLVFIGLQAYRSVKRPIKTETAVSYSTFKGVSATALVIRDETIIFSDATGVKNYKIADGNRVRKDGTVIEIFNDIKTAQAGQKTAAIDEEIDALNEIMRMSEGYVLHTKLLADQLTEKLFDLRKLINSGDYIEIAQRKKEYTDIFNKYRIGKGKEKDYKERLNLLREEKKQLQAEAKTPVNIKSPQSGFFVGAVDGYENIMKSSDALTVDFNKYEALLNQKKTPEANAVGKVVTNYEWYLLCSVPENETSDIVRGTEIMVNLPFAVSHDLPATVLAVNAISGKNSIVVLQCSEMFKEISNIRTQYVRLITNQYSGLRVNRNAVVFNDGERGVYVMEGQEVRFKKIDSLYAESSYLIVSLDTQDSTFLQLYDEVIVEGKDLYEGKVITK